MKRIHLIGTAFSLLMLCFSVASFAQNDKLPEGVTKNTSVEGITEYQLENGLKVLLFPDPSKATVTVNVTYLVGSRHEGYGETGMAHLLEHLVFKGTPNHEDIPKEMKDRGASFNGTTWYDRTNYFETVPASDENLAWALDLESDRMVNSYIAKEDLDSEMSVVRNEFEIGENSPVGILMERTMATSYIWHNYGNTTIGARADIENVPIDRLQAFYRKYYQPDNAILTVAGKIDEAKTLEMVNKYFGKIPRPARELIPTYTKEPTQDGERMVTLQRSGDVQVVSAMYHTPPGPHPDYAPVNVLVELLTSEPSGRLYKALVETKKASSQWGFSPGLKEGGFAYFNVDVRKENSLEEAKMTLLNTLDSVSIIAPTQEEVDRAKTRILKNWDLAYNNSGRIGVRLSESIAQGDWRLFFLFRDNVEQVELEDVIQVAEKYFKTSNRTVGMFIPTTEPDRAEIPDAPDVAALVANYEGRESISAGEEFDPSPENIESRTKKHEGSNGIEFALLSKETRGDAVVANMTLRMGNEAALKGKTTIGEMTASMLDKGTTSMTRQEIQDKLDELNSRVRIFGDEQSVSVRIETERDNLPATIELISDILKNPSFSEEEFNKLKEERLAQIEQNLSEPQALVFNTLSRSLSPYDKGNIRYVMTMEEEIEAVKATSLEDIKKFYKDFYGITNGATASVVGDFDEKEIKALVSKEFSGWKSATSYKRVKSTFTANKTGNKDIETPDKSNAVFAAGMKIKMSEEHPDYPAMVMGNNMLGGGALSNRLANRIRQKDGLSYAVGSVFQARPKDESAALYAYAFYAPENKAALEKAFKEEVEKAVTEGFTQEEFDAARKGWLERQNLNRSQDAALAGKLNSNLFNDRTMMWDKKMEEKMNQLTLEEVNATMKKYVDVEKMILVKGGDFAGAAKKEAKP
ncbi:MAG: pitrilysin family protein [Bacteroidota bacterium]